MSVSLQQRAEFLHHLDQYRKYLDEFSNEERDVRLDLKDEYERNGCIITLERRVHMMEVAGINALLRMIVLLARIYEDSNPGPSDASGNMVLHGALEDLHRGFFKKDDVQLFEQMLDQWNID